MFVTIQPARQPKVIEVTRSPVLPKALLSALCAASFLLAGA
jgi:hypothetical protein